MVNTMFIEVGSLSSHNADSFVGCEFFFFFLELNVNTFFDERIIAELKSCLRRINEIFHVWLLIPMIKMTMEKVELDLYMLRSLGEIKVAIDRLVVSAT